jgi:mono/diheme cytochrome c family protein
MPLALDGLSLFLTPEENVELARYRRVAEAGYTVPRPDTKGVNAADVAFGIIAAHRDQSTLEWRAESKPEAHLGRNLAYTDVPAWWNVRRRDRMFYSGVGQGSHARIMMSAALMCLDNNAEAAEIDEYFGDVEAFILSLRPPRYVDVAKRSPDSVRAAAGRTVFMNTCSGCHGDSQNEVPPVLTVPAAVVGTDPLYATNASANGDGAIAYYFDFFNGTWFGTQGDAGRVERTATPVYSPPPLDGIWATAPYFHNASVPTLEAVLNPALRPRIYRRSFKPEEYQFGCTPSTSPCTKVVGWPYTTLSSKGTDTTIYDTTRAGYGNQGHTFAAGLTDAQRRDLLEYLKTL